ncbi:MAG: ribonuclease PH [Gemmatimonadetes bacterium]|nr:ribonuclease PH [Gemmatimonadota bacterium]
MRYGGRQPGELRPLQLDLGAAEFAEGSCLITAGRTRVLCTASIQDGVPGWRAASGAGWVTAEYAMLPRATPQRTPRDRGAGSGRTQEIQRLIGRSLRAVTNLETLGPRTIVVDCDVLQADGGTRTAAISGGAAALYHACRRLVVQGELPANPVRELVAAVSAGIVDRECRLDLDYAEDSAASVDMNVVATASGRFVEVQGTAEGQPFSRSELDELLDLALAGIRRIIAAQDEALRAGTR